MFRKTVSKMMDCRVTRDIQTHLNADRPRIVVRRERRGDSSRSDIDVYTRGSDAFLIRIEHKIRGTLIGGKYQTERLKEDAGNFGIDSKRVIGIFLTPAGEPAEDREFVALSYKEFANAVTRAVVSGHPAAAGISTAVASVLGFMSFYRRL